MSPRRFGSALLLLAALGRHAAAQSGVLGGMVFRDSAEHPLGGAEVTIPALNRGARTNYLGEFRMDRLPAGRYAVAVRFLGFAPFTDSVTVSDGKVVEREYVLTEAPALLDSQRVVAKTMMDEPHMAEFEERRKAGIGRFIGREELRKVEGGRPLMNYVASTIAGLRLFRPNRKDRPGDWFIGSSGHGGSNRATASSNCAVALYIDGNPFFVPGVTRTPDGGAPDISQLSADDFSAVEYYPDGAGAPARYNTSNMGCGVMLFWRRYRR
jgi:hypothetical protein